MAICRFERAPAEFSANVVLLTSQSGGGGMRFSRQVNTGFGAAKKNEKKAKLLQMRSG